MKNKESIYKGIIVVLLLIIAFGGSFFASELKNNSCNSNEEVRDVNNISYSNYKELLKGKEWSIVYIGRPGCSYCQKQLPIVKQILNSYDVVVNYLNTDNLSSEELNELISGYNAFNGGENFGTPTFLIVGKNKVEDGIIGYTEKDNLIDLFSKYNLIKE